MGVLLEMHFNHEPEDPSQMQKYEHCTTDEIIASVIYHVALMLKGYM
jgi:hypothetical protein